MRLRAARCVTRNALCVRIRVPIRSSWKPWAALPCAARFALALSAFSSPAVAQTLPPELAAAVPKWEEYFHKATSLEGTLHIQSSEGGVVSDSTSEATFAIEGSSAYFRSRNTIPGKTYHFVNGINPDYAFALSSRDANASRWHQDRFDWDRPTLNSTDSLRRFIGHGPIGEQRNPIEYALSDVLDGLRIESTWFPYMVRAPSFRVTSIERLAGADIGLVRIAFHYQPKKPDDNNVVRSGEVELDSKRFWLIRRAKVTADFYQAPGGTLLVTNAYDDQAGSIPLIKSQEIRTLSKNTAGKTIDSVRVLSFSIKPIADDTRKYFRLSGFSIPEPVRPSLERAYWWLGHGLAVVAVGIAAALGLRWWARRQSKSQRV